mmetsp:Transcript_41087/g.113188  ORF Transcript_41087/g.113188 Transcript_41087/m.113188 type:complete len:206 (+) Transcript_41087:212-829(+)
MALTKICHVLLRHHWGNVRQQHGLLARLDVDITVLPPRLRFVLRRRDPRHGDNALQQGSSGHASELAADDEGPAKLVLLAGLQHVRRGAVRHPCEGKHLAVVKLQHVESRETPHRAVVGGLVPDAYSEEVDNCRIGRRPALHHSVHVPCRSDGPCRSRGHHPAPVHRVDDSVHQRGEVQRYRRIAHHSPGPLHARVDVQSFPEPM